MNGVIFFLSNNNKNDCILLNVEYTFMLAFYSDFFNEMKDSNYTVIN